MLPNLSTWISFRHVLVRCKEGGVEGGVMHSLLVVAETQFASAIWQMKISTWDRPQRPFVSASVTTQFVDDFEVILRVGKGGT